MSITAAPKRAYDQIQSSPELPPQHRLPMNALPSFDNLTNTPMAANTPPPAPHIGPQPMSIADRTPTTLPKVGQTRCYWSLLTPELQFLYLDPVLASHLSQQSDKLIGKSLLTFVHPDEQTSAERDLGSVLESRTLHGSVTRVRWARISSVRRQLGYQGPDEEWGDALKPGEDPNYMSIDVVINWAADGLVLCFMHAAKDKEARDNDENDKTHWSNWCGTPYLSVEQVQLLYDQLSKRVTPSPTLHRVFQVLLNKPERPLWLSWPPDPPLGQGPTSKEFARLAAEVQIGNSAQNGTDAKTSCTRRYKALQTMHMGPEGTQEVESIFIPYGSIIFACHRVNQRPTPIAPQSMYGANNHHGQQQQQHYNSQYYEQTYSVPAVAPPNHGNGYGPPQSGYPSHTWPASGADSSSPSHSHWGPQGAPQAPPYMENGQSQYSYPPPAGQYQGRSSSPVVHDPPSPGSDVVPASRIPRRGNRERDNYANGRGAGNPPTGVGRCASCKVTHSPEWRKGPSGKKDLCNACGLRYARSRAKKEGSAQRRRKDRMINMATRDDSPSTSTAGSMYSASGGPPSGRPYDDTPYSANSASGSESYARHGGPPPPPGPSGSSASASGPIPTPSPDQQNFIPYSYAGHNQYTQKQSPSSASPPSRQIPPPPPGLPHQPQQSGPQSSSSSQSAQQQDQHYPVTTTQTQTSTQTQPSPFYSVPPPPPSHGGQIHHGSSVSASAGSSSHPRLDTYSSTRRSPGHSPASTTHSPVSTGFSAASFERDRHDRDREKERDRLPPTPDSADPRY